MFLCPCLIPRKLIFCQGSISTAWGIGGMLPHLRSSSWIPVSFSLSDTEWKQALFCRVFPTQDSGTWLPSCHFSSSTVNRVPCEQGRSRFSPLLPYLWLWKTLFCLYGWEAWASPSFIPYATQGHFSMEIINLNGVLFSPNIIDYENSFCWTVHGTYLQNVFFQLIWASSI